MIKKVIRSVIIFWGIFALFQYLYGVYSFYAAYTDNGEIIITTWLDSNANGIQDPNENPLPNICTWYVYSPKAEISENLNKCKDE
jgi:hypothetical protein